MTSKQTFHLMETIVFRKITLAVGISIVGASVMAPAAGAKPIDPIGVAVNAPSCSESLQVRTTYGERIAASLNLRDNNESWRAGWKYTPLCANDVIRYPSATFAGPKAAGVELASTVKFHGTSRSVFITPKSNAKDQDKLVNYCRLVAGDPPLTGSKFTRAESSINCTVQPNSKSLDTTLQRYYQSSGITVNVNNSTGYADASQYILTVNTGWTSCYNLSSYRTAASGSAGGVAGSINSFFNNGTGKCN